jgi:ribosomal protein S18 acetylase RimI-like enzyme
MELKVPSPKVMSGGCQCGAVRYRFEGENPGHAELCHCRMCQKAGGNFGLALIQLDADKLVWTRGRPREFRSSPIVSRGFCEGCGTPLYMREDGDPQYEIAMGSLDDPGAFPPSRAVGVESKLRWFDTLAALPARRTDEDRAPEELATLTSLQHPDHDTQYGPGREDVTDSSPWRPAAEQDFDRIIEMNARLNAEDPSETMPFDGTMMRRTLAELRVNPVRGAVAVLALGGRRCGYALLISFWSNEFGGEICAIDELYVEPEFRGRGFATQLVQSVARGDSRIWPRRPALVTVEAYRTNPRAKALYEKLGFEASPNHALALGLAGRRADPWSAPGPGALATPRRRGHEVGEAT